MLSDGLIPSAFISSSASAMRDLIIFFSPKWALSSWPNSQGSTEAKVFIFMMPGFIYQLPGGKIALVPHIHRGTTGAPVFYGQMECAGMEPAQGLIVFAGAFGEYNNADPRGQMGLGQSKASLPGKSFHIKIVCLLHEPAEAEQPEGP